jgi:hypothetical protein
MLSFRVSTFFDRGFWRGQASKVVKATSLPHSLVYSTPVDNLIGVEGAKALAANLPLGLTALYIRGKRITCPPLSIHVFGHGFK